VEEQREQQFDKQWTLIDDQEREDEDPIEVEVKAIENRVHVVDNVVRDERELACRCCVESDGRQEVNKGRQNHLIAWLDEVQDGRHLLEDKRRYPCLSSSKYKSIISADCTNIAMHDALPEVLLDPEHQPDEQK
jgi:hypothetical protein